MPFGRKPDAAGRMVDFDRVYEEPIAPAVAAADLEPLRAGEEMTGGIIHRPMWEPETTARNLRLIREARERRSEPVSWAVEVEEALAGSRP
jgi:hypothetical protein